MIGGEITIAQQKRRIAELERRNVGLVKECQAQQEQITELKNALTRQAKAAQQGMAAAKKHGSHMESEAKRLHAECNPEALEGEREANAKLTELVAELESQVEQHKAAEEVQMALRQKAEEREAALAAHVETLKDALEDITQAAQQEGLHFSGWQEQVSNAVSAMLSSTASNLTHRDLIKQAEALEDARGFIIYELLHSSQAVIYMQRRADELRQRAAAL